MTLNPMEAYRRAQKKKELKKHRMERLKEKQAKLSSMDPVKIREQLKNCERQVTANSADGPARKRKQELENTLRVVVKKQKELADEERKKQVDASFRPQSMAELDQMNKQKFQNAENSIYYHPTMNPFGAPPPGKPQMYRDMPSIAVPGSAPRGPPGQGRYHDSFVLRGVTKGGRGLSPSSNQQFREVARRPGKRPPLPPGPPPPGTIQVPLEPPLPSGLFPARPPPPPPTVRPPPPSQPPPSSYDQTMQPDVVAPSALRNHSVETAYSTAYENANDKIVVPGPLPHKSAEVQDVDEQAAESAAENRAQLCSLVPVALRVQRHSRAPSKSSVATFDRTSPSLALRPPLLAPPAPVPQPAVGVSLSHSRVTSNSAYSSSVSTEFDAFIENVKELL